MTCKVNRSRPWPPSMCTMPCWRCSAAARDEARLRAFEASGQTVQAFADMYGFDPRDAARTVERAQRRRQLAADAVAAADAAAAAASAAAEVAPPEAADDVPEASELPAAPAA